MASYEFKIKPHSVLPGQLMAEVWRDGAFLAGIYPHQDGIRVVSKYLAGVEEEPLLPAKVRITTVIIKLAGEPTW